MEEDSRTRYSRRTSSQSTHSTPGQRANCCSSSNVRSIGVEYAFAMGRSIRAALKVWVRVRGDRIAKGQLAHAPVTVNAAARPVGSTAASRGSSGGGAGKDVAALILGMAGVAGNP